MLLDIYWNIITIYGPMNVRNVKLLVHTSAYTHVLKRLRDLLIYVGEGDCCAEGVK